jgi:hypothetical protein
MLYSIIPDIIPVKAKGSEYLCTEKEVYVYEKGANKIRITLLIFKASAICFAPASLISLQERLRVVSFYV